MFSNILMIIGFLVFTSAFVFNIYLEFAYWNLSTLKMYIDHPVETFSATIGIIVGIILIVFGKALSDI